MKITTLTFLTLLSSLSLNADLVPGGDFQMYKAGTNYTVTATFVPGTNSFARGVGDGIDLAGGSAAYSDGSSFVAAGDGLPDIDLPGWVPLQSGNDLVDNGVDGTTGMNLFAAWGGDGRIQSAESLGILQSGSVYTITAMVGGPASGPIQGPLAFHLMADGVQLVPSEIVDPILPASGAFQLISRTYDASSIAEHVGAEITIVLGVEDANDFANRVIFDDVSMEVESSAPAPLSITANAENPGHYDFTWGSKLGKLYDLVSSEDLSTTPDTWPVWEGQSDIEGTSTKIALLDIPGGSSSKRFFALVEK